MCIPARGVARYSPVVLLSMVSRELPENCPVPGRSSSAGSRRRKRNASAPSASHTTAILPAY